MNGINNDVLKVNYGNGDSGSRRLGLCGDRSHWLDTLNVATVAVEMEKANLLR